MVIRTIGETYRVICTLKGSRDIRAYLCIRDKQDDGEKFLLMEPKERELSGKMLLYFMELSKSGRVEGLIECFAKNGVVWLVFRYFEGCMLTEKLKTGLLFSERLDIGRELMMQIFAQNLPVYLQYEASIPDNITVSTQHGVKVNFLLFHPYEMDNDLFPAVQRNAAACMDALFGKELKAKLQKELSGFVGKLRGGEFSGDADIFRAYLRMEEALREAYDRGELQKNGYFTSLRQSVAGGLKYIFCFLYYVLITGLWAVLIYVCVGRSYVPEGCEPFCYIGTLAIKGYALEPEHKEPETEQDTEVLPDIRQTEDDGSKPGEHETEDSGEHETPEETDPAEMG